MTEQVSTPSFETYGGSAPENYEQYFVPAIGAPLAETLVEIAAIDFGERVLDVACGTGVVARLASAGVGPTGSIAGLDINPGMLAVARATAAPALAIDWHEAPAEAAPFPDDSYDVVLCQLGLQFFPDRVAALREIRRVLVPGGRMVLNLPGPTPPVFEILADALASHVNSDVAGFVHHVFSLHDTHELEQLLSSAGFGEIAVASSTTRLRLPAPADFLWQYVHSTPLAAAVKELDHEQRAALEHAAVTGWARFTRDGALSLSLDVLHATARKD